MSRIALFTRLSLTFISLVLLSQLTVQQAFGDHAVANTEGKPSTVYLDKGSESGFTLQNNRVATILSRELVRQALLVSAQVEIGLQTRDYWLGDPMPSEGKNPPIEILGSEGQKNVLRLKRKYGEFEEIEIPELLNFDQAYSYKLLLERSEAWSRDGAAQLLKECGFNGTAIKAGSQLVPEAVEKLLAEMNAFSQFQAVRTLHTEIRAQRESPQLVGALVRGYSNLGVLTESFLHPAHKVFKARALLYAQRLRMKDGQERVGKWHRAYAFALSGLQANALSDIGEAKKLESEAEQSSVPEWLGLIEAYCRYEATKLTPDDAPEGHRQLAALLQFLARAGSGSVNLTVEAGRQLIAESPECYLAYDIMNRAGPLGVLHEMTAAAPKTMATKLYPRLQEIEGLPSDVEAVLKFHKVVAAAGLQHQQRMAIIKALLESEHPKQTKDEAKTDLTAEPSWATLGLLIRETGFAQVHQRVAFEAQMLGVSPDRTLASAKRLYDSHPLRALILSYSSDPKKRQSAIAALSKAELDGLDYRAISAFQNLRTAGRDLQARFGGTLEQNNDTITGDLLLPLYRMHDRRAAAAIAFALGTINPESPLVIAASMDAEQLPFAKATPAEIEKKAGDHAITWASLGRRYLREEKLGDAERCLRKAIELGKEMEAYMELANMYGRQGHIDKWLDTLQEYLKEPSQGLEHARVQSDIANYFISVYEWEKAWPFAKDSAETYWARGLVQAGCVAEARQDFEAAEQYFRAVSTRYPTSAMHWYLFCRRTGQGDLQAAKAVAAPYIAAFEGATYRPGMELFPLICFMLDDKPDDAFNFLANTDADPYLNMWAAVNADAKGDAKDRDRRLKLIDDGAIDPQFADLREFAELLIDDVADGAKGDFTAADIRKITANRPEGPNYLILYFGGNYLSQRKKHAEAVNCWKGVMGLNDIVALPRTLAGAHLWAQGIGPEAYRDQLQRKK